MKKYNLNGRQLKTFSAVDMEYAIDAVNGRAAREDWYVLRFDTYTEDYNNDIEFQTLEEAEKKFAATEPAYRNERVELIFAPDNEDEDFEDNCVINYKTYPRASK